MENKNFIELRTTEMLVRKLLRDDAACRNSDKLLTFRVCRYLLGQSGKDDKTLVMSVEDLDKLPAFETIKRVRAVVQNVEKQFLPSDAEVRKRRKIREDDFLLWAQCSKFTA